MFVKKLKFLVPLSIVYILFLHKSVDVLTKLNMHHVKDFSALLCPLPHLLNEVVAGLTKSFFLGIKGRIYC